MRCPFCGEDEDKVNDSRQSKDGREIRRRRECLRCGRRFTTYERIEESMPMVIKRDGRREAFDRAKIERGLGHAVAKLPVSLEAVRRLAEEVEREIGELGLDEIPSRAVGERVLPRLRALDPVAYVRFASIYREFRDLDGFVRELQAIGATAARAESDGDGGGGGEGGDGDGGGGAGGDGGRDGGAAGAGG